MIKKRPVKRIPPPMCRQKSRRREQERQPEERQKRFWKNTRRRAEKKQNSHRGYQEGLCPRLTPHGKPCRSHRNQPG